VAVSAFPTSTAEASRPAGAAKPLLLCRLGSVSYDEAWDLQRRLAEARRQDIIPDVLLLLEHPHTYTLGRRGNEENILLSPAELEQRGIAVHRVDRGGDVTYHGPGQLVGYPILQLPAERLDYVRYIRDVERALLLAVRDLGVPAHLQEGFSGVWIGPEKVCAIGVKIDAYGVTTHGFALNVNVDLSYFGHIIPCGITDKGVTSLHRLLKRRVSTRRVERLVVQRLAEAFGLSVGSRSVGRASLERRVASGTQASRARA
jgi:lipoyl(octanoyl) transferase